MPWTEIKTALAAVPQWFGTQFQNAWTNIKNAFANVTSFFSGLWDKIKGCFVDVGVKIGSAVGDAFKSAINSCLATIEGVVNKFIRMINGVIGIINEIPGSFPGKYRGIIIATFGKGRSVARGNGHGSRSRTGTFKHGKWKGSCYAADRFSQKPKSGKHRKRKGRI